MDPVTTPTHTQSRKQNEISKERRLNSRGREIELWIADRISLNTLILCVVRVLNHFDPRAKKKRVQIIFYTKYVSDPNRRLKNLDS